MHKIKEIINLSFPRFFRYFACHSVYSEEGKVLVAEVQGEVSGFAKLIEFNIGQQQVWLYSLDCGSPCLSATEELPLSLTNAGVDYSEKRVVHKRFLLPPREETTRHLATLGKAGFGRMGFLGLWRLFGWRVFSFYREIWYAPGEIVLMKDF